MNTNNAIASIIFKEFSFSKEDREIIAAAFQKKSFTKGDIIIKEGDLVDDLYYIYDGCLRTFHNDVYGKEHTIQFGIKDWWITDYTAFFLSSEALMNLEVLQDCTVYALSKENRELLYNKFPQIDKYIRVKLERAYAAFQKRILANLSQSAATRYLEFVNTHPDIEKMVKNYHIASYLGITTESLSRIRKNIA
ncbi:Crp/Fnr family transcriptional regulator [Lacinutrix chionoecetis]